jgi:SAM-dependent methyltransferase
MLKSCAGCGSSALRSFIEVCDERGLRHALVRCRSCRLAQVLSPPAPEELAAFYARYSYESACAWQTSFATERSLEALARRLAPYRQLGRLLDVGCGAGILMQALRRHGWSAEGTELSGVAVERLRAQGFIVHHGSLEALALDAAGYDVVVMSETIEHVLDPHQALRFAARVLRRAGVLFLTTPNVDSLSRRLLGARWRALCYPDHLFYFNLRSLSFLLRNAGFRPTAVWTEGINPCEFRQAWRSPRREARAQVIRDTEALRTAAATSTTYRLLKAAVNAVLGVLRMGDTLKALAERPSHA